VLHILKYLAEFPATWSDAFPQAISEHQENPNNYYVGDI
jgi:hypothetical protein